MSTRRPPFSTLLPFIGAAVVTAGAVLFQIARRPAIETATPARPMARTTARPANPSLVGSGKVQPPSAEDESLLKRLRERGL
jgi:hypothetical protein